MAKKQENPKETQPLGPETQKQRWVKYGGNVALTMLLVIGIGVAVIYLASRSNVRIDMTSAGLYSLKPQTVNIISDLQQPIEIISLYSTEVPQGEMIRRTTTRQQRRDWEQEVRQEAERVADLLDEYASKGRNITVQWIDPVRQEGKVNELIQRVASKYGGEVVRYRDYIDKYHDFTRKVADTAAAQAVRVQGLPVEQLQQSPDRNQQQAAMAVLFMRDTLGRMFKDVDRAIERRLQESPPDYRGAANSVRNALDQFGQYADSFSQIAQQQAAQANVPQPVRDYLSESVETIKSLNEAAQQVRDAADELGDLKLDDFRESLSKRNTILVLGESDMRVLDYETVWQTDPRDVSRGSTELKPRFAGEQQVTSAILSLTRQQKPKVAIVRNGGPPMTDPGFPPFQPAGELSILAQRLRDYNFEVLEKDLSNMWAMQAQMRGQPAPQEPSDEELRDAIWIVVNSPNSGGGLGGMGGATIAPQVMEHVTNGGSALILFLPRASSMEEFLKDWGLRVRTDALAVHPPVDLMGTPSDLGEAAKGEPPVFVVNEYADHPITRPLRSLDTLLYAMVSVKPAETTPEGIKVTPLVTLPPTPQAWGETDLQNPDVTFDEFNDVTGPLYGAVALEKEGANRLVVMASMYMAHDNILTLPDTTLLQQGIRAARFPGNQELLLNSVFWLADLETMMAISPSAMEISRITGLSDQARRAWGIGVLWGGLPLSVVAVGVMVYYARRD